MRIELKRGSTHAHADRAAGRRRVCRRNRSKLAKLLPRREVLEPHGHERVVVRTRVVQRRRRAVPDAPVVADDDVTFIHRGPVRNCCPISSSLGDVRLAVGAATYSFGVDARVRLVRRAGDVRRRRLITNIQKEDRVPVLFPPDILMPVVRFLPVSHWTWNMQDPPVFMGCGRCWGQRWRVLQKCFERLADLPPELRRRRPVLLREADEDVALLIQIG